MISEELQFWDCQHQVAAQPEEEEGRKLVKEGVHRELTPTDLENFHECGCLASGRRREGVGATEGGTGSGTEPLILTPADHGCRQQPRAVQLKHHYDIESIPSAAVDLLPPLQVIRLSRPLPAPAALLREQPFLLPAHLCSGHLGCKGLDADGNQAPDTLPAPAPRLPPASGHASLCGPNTAAHSPPARPSHRNVAQNPGCHNISNHSSMLNRFCRGVISSGPSAFLAGQGQFGLNTNGLAECPRCRGNFVEVLTEHERRRIQVARW
jgi:hypothetical protein